MFKDEIGEMTKDEYKLLNNLFLDVDAFYDNPELRDENDIDEVELIESCRETFNKLNVLTQLPS